MYRQHEYDATDRCIHCGGSRALIVRERWDCAPLHPLPVDGPRKEIVHDFSSLVRYVKAIPCVQEAEGYNEMADLWNFHLKLDITHEIAWHVVQYFAYVLNGLSLSVNLPTRFFPITPPVDLNGGPYDFLGWMIQCSDPQFSPDRCRDWLASRLPTPVGDITAWKACDE
jgi:hypothetical protein